MNFIVYRLLTVWYNRAIWGGVKMYLKQIPNKKSGRVFLSIVEPYRHKESGNTRTKTVKALGYLDELEKEMDDPITYYKEVARR
jgi:hypothetical protein